MLGKNLFLVIKNQSKSFSQKTKAQSMVEFAISLPILIILFSGMVEFGFMLNTYLSLQDATRAAARYYANSAPFKIENEGTPSEVIVDDEDFYPNVANFVINTLAPTDYVTARQIPVDPSRDNILVSVISVDVDETLTPPAISTITRHPDGAEFYYHYNTTSPSSLYTDDVIEDFMTTDSSTPVDAGLLIIEIYYSYEGVLGLPWTLPFFSESDPTMLYASTIMPLVAAKP